MWIFLATLTLVVFHIIYQSVRLGISPLPTHSKSKKALLQLLPETPSGEVWELGCGWGTLLRELCRKYPNHRVVGYEASFFPWLVCWIRSRFWNHPRLVLRHKDFFQDTLQPAGLLVCYLYTGAMKQIEPLWKTELQQGTVLISNTFSLPNQTAEKILVVEDWYRSRIYRYKVD